MSGIGAFRDWIILQGLEATGQEEFLEGLARRLADEMPLDRLTIGVPSLDPNIRGVSFTWSADSGVSTEFAAHGAEGEALFRLSPIYQVLESGLTEKNWRLREGEGIAEHPLLERLAAEGIAHYALKLVGFPNEPQVSGMAFILSTADPAGFSPAHHALVNAALPAIGLAVYRIELSRTAREMLRVYVGARTSDRILSGSVHRGDGEAIDAAILFADLKGFAALSETRTAPEIVALLNGRFDLLDAPIVEHGGEILKFMGDGLLAVFPLSEGAGKTEAACARALRAAREALAANEALNHHGAAAGQMPVGLDIALHLGELFYGNIGAARRLDFTVIGQAVNLASRIEKLCDPLGRNLVLSRSFAQRCGAPTVPLGRFKLKGIAAPQEVFGCDDGIR